MRVALASEGWPPYPSDTSMFAISRDTLAAVRAAGVDAYPLSLASNRGARVGGLLRPLWRRTVGRYRVPPGTIVHQLTQNTLRDVDIVTIHDLAPFYETRGIDAFFRQQVRVAFRRARRIVLTTEACRRDVTERFPEHREKLRVVPVPLPTPPPGIGPVRFDALWVGRNSPNKDLPAYLALAARFPARRFALRSSRSPGREALDRHVETLLARTRNVEVVPRQSEEGLDRLYRSAPILVVTSQYEGFHIPAMEAYLRGMKLVLPQREPFVELYPDRCAFFYPPEAGAAGLAQAFDRALAAPLVAPDSAIVDRVSLARVGQRLRAVYEELG